MRGWRIGLQRVSRPDVRRLLGLRVLGMTLATVLLVSACGSKEEVVYVDHADTGHGAYTPFARSASPRVHKDGAHHEADAVQIGSEHPAEYAPIAASGSLLVHKDGAPRTVQAFALEYERSAGLAGSIPYPTPFPAGAPGLAAHGASAHSGAAKPGSVAQSALAAPSPTAEPRLSLGAGLGATAGARTGGNAIGLAPGDAEDIDELATVAGRVESINGPIVTVKSPTGTSHVKLADRARVDRDALGTATDLKPGQFVGAVQTLGGPASSVRLYATGPSTPRPGIVPLIGSRTGQVTTFGSVVTLQFGGLLLNTGGETTTVTLPAGIEILKPAQADPSALAVGAQIIATGTMSADNVLAATAVRITGEARPGR